MVSNKNTVENQRSGLFASDSWSHWGSMHIPWNHPILTWFISRVNRFVILSPYWWNFYRQASTNVNCVVSMRGFFLLFLLAMKWKLYLHHSGISICVKKLGELMAQTLKNISKIYLHNKTSGYQRRNTDNKSYQRLSWHLSNAQQVAPITRTLQNPLKRISFEQKKKWSGGEVNRVVRSRSRHELEARSRPSRVRSAVLVVLAVVTTAAVAIAVAGQRFQLLGTRLGQRV